MTINLGDKDIELETMSVAELKQLRSEIEKAIKNAEIRDKKEALSKIRQIALEHGMSLEDLIDKPSKSKGSAGLPKYRHPENPEKTWTGKGRRPKWVAEHLSAGRPLDELKI